MVKIEFQTDYKVSLLNNENVHEKSERKAYFPLRFRLLFTCTLSMSTKLKS